MEDFIKPEEDKLKVIIGDHIRWELEVAYYKSMGDYYMLLSDLSKALLMGNDQVASAEINRLCDAFPEGLVREDLRTQYLETASKLKPVDWPSYFPKPI